jgi:hypothetical protein
MVKFLRIFDYRHCVSGFVLTSVLSLQVVSWMRAVGPAVANSLYSVSLKEGRWTVYWVLEAIAFVAIAGALQLPRNPWRS